MTSVMRRKPDPKAAMQVLGHQPFAMGETAVRLLLRMPYVMVVYYSLQIYKSDKIETLAINGVAMWVNPKFWAQLDRDQKVTAVAHELGHKMLMHPTRRGERNQLVYNVAGDHVINLMLTDNGFKPLTGMTINGEPWSWCCDHKYRGMTTEAVYDALMQELSEPDQPTGEGDQDDEGDEEGDEEGSQSGQDDGEEGEEGGSDSESGADADGDVDDTGTGGTGADDDGASGVPGTGSSNRGTGGGAADEEDRERDTQQSPESEAAAKQLGPMRDLLDFGTDPEGNPYQDPEKFETPRDFEQRMRKELREAEMQAKMHGNVPGWLERVIGNAEHSKIDWREVVAEYLRGMTQSDYSWARMNRREFYKTRAIAPDLYQPSMGGILLLVDCSGSISGHTLGSFSKRYREILEEIKPAWVQVVYWDTIPYPPYDRFERGEFDEDTSRLKPRGGGGTTFEWAADLIEDMDELPEVAMCLTDLYIGDFGREPVVPMLWLVTGEVESAPYGVVINID
jgi:predicted metal-dependent peptidase